MFQESRIYAVATSGMRLSDVSPRSNTACCGEFHMWELRAHFFLYSESPHEAWRHQTPKVGRVGKRGGEDSRQHPGPMLPGTLFPSPAGEVQVKSQQGPPRREREVVQVQPITGK